MVPADNSLSCAPAEPPAVKGNSKKTGKPKQKKVTAKAAASKPRAVKPVTKQVLKKPAAKKAAAKPKVELIPQSVRACLSGVPPARPVRVWTVASDCSGLCTEGLASKLAFGPSETKVIHKYASEACPEKRRELF